MQPVRDAAYRLVAAKNLFLSRHPCPNVEGLINHDHCEKILSQEIREKIDPLLAWL
jgi:hypothetical protein